MMKTLTQLTTPLLTGGSVEQKRAELKQYFVNTWQSYNDLFSLINNHQAFYQRPEPLRHPLIFYFGHTAVFYINKLILGKYIKQRINPKLEAICAVGVDEMSWDDLNSEHYDWPSVDEVIAYRGQVQQLIEQLIDTMELSLPITQDSLAWIILMGSEHERIHIETSSVIMRMLPLADLTDNGNWPCCTDSGSAPQNQLLAVTGKAQVLGKLKTDQTYGWDNEYGELKVEVDDFRASQFLVSNQEYLGFVDAGGYQQLQWWTEEGQHWLQYTKATMPRFWRKTEQGYMQRNLLSEMPLPLNWPVEVNYLEAKAFCNWLAETQQKFIRLPTEAEWYCLRDLLPTDLVEWQETPANINLAYYASSCPVNRFACDEFYDVIGNVWQWTESAIDSFNGFSVHPLYDDFSTPTFDGRHNLFKGGSWISTGNEAIKSSRYAFRRHFFQHAGFRYIEAQSAEIPATPVNVYETNTDVCQQLALHFGEGELNQGNYAQQLARKVQQICQQYQAKTEKLLDLGASVGRVSFELAPAFDWIDAIDFSARYIQHGVKAQTEGRVKYTSVNEGELVDFNEVTLADLALNQAQNILFSQGDAANLKTLFTGYDVVLAQQVLERCYQPAKFLQRLPERVNANGLLILVSDYQFNSAVTEQAYWLGGIKVNGENVTGFDGVSQKLNKHFSLLATDEITQIVRQNSRQYQVKQLQITIWRKHS